MKKKKEKYRQWLNPTSSYSDKSFVIAAQGNNDSNHDGHTLTLHDCYRQVEFEFTGGRYRKSSLSKLKKLQDSLAKIEAWLKED